VHSVHGKPNQKPNFFFVDQAAVQDPDWVRGPYAEQRALRTLRGPSVPHRADRDQATQVRSWAFQIGFYETVVIFGALTGLQTLVLL
jgi:hypothetical protein